jgi:hypothetical protein
MLGPRAEAREMNLRRALRLYAHEDIEPLFIADIIAGTSICKGYRHALLESSKNSSLPCVCFSR